jgi:protein-L-isoaspartate(D-aspartate) O-methyltransferase
MGVRGVEMQHADGLNPTRLLGRFDRIILNGVTGQIPEGLLQRLSPGGRLVGVVPVDGVTRLVSVRRTAENGSEQRHGPPIRLPPLAPGLAETL